MVDILIVYLFILFSLQSSILNYVRGFPSRVSSFIFGNFLFFIIFIRLIIYYISYFRKDPGSMTLMTESFLETSFIDEVFVFT